MDFIALNYTGKIMSFSSHNDHIFHVLKETKPPRFNTNVLHQIYINNKMLNLSSGQNYLKRSKMSENFDELSDNLNALKTFLMSFYGILFFFFNMF